MKWVDIMAGLICGFYGFQRSGKTLLATMIAESYRRKGVKVYTNMDVKGFIKISSLNDLPVDHEPKVLLLDEAYWFLDSRDWEKTTKSSIFFNTLGKHNFLFLFTAISPDMIDMRIRKQQNYVFMAKGNSKFITYKILDVQRQRSRLFVMPKSEDVFNFVQYRTLDVPDIINVDFDKFIKRSVMK